MKLLLETEVAELLRCSRQKVKRLRLSGQLAYLPGRPVKIAEADLFAYLEQAKTQVTTPTQKPIEGKTASASLEQSAREWALRLALKKTRAPRRPR